jgi:glycosyltransferase involved in cell wall biosynthesis
MISVVIAAHNEEAVLGPCLDALLASARTAGAFDVTVVANGCTDATAAVAARRSGVRVLDRPAPGKAGALNAGDAVAVGWPRLYLDADVRLVSGTVHDLADALAKPTEDGAQPLAAVPRRRLDLTARPWLVRAFYAINTRLPAYDRALFGRGAIAISEAGRGRFAAFPDMIADDLFLDSLFAADERVQVDAVVSLVATPRRTRDLVRRLARVRAGNAAMRAAAVTGDMPSGVRRAANTSWLRDVVLPRPWLLPAAACYVGIILAAAVTARRARRGGIGWGHDLSSRTDPRSVGSAHPRPTPFPPDDERA